MTLTEIGTSAWCATFNVVEVGFDDEPEAFSTGFTGWSEFIHGKFLLFFRLPMLDH